MYTDDPYDGDIYSTSRAMSGSHGGVTAIGSNTALQSFEYSCLPKRWNWELEVKREGFAWGASALQPLHLS
jgi:hypothetical protein